MKKDDIAYIVYLGLVILVMCSGYLYNCSYKAGENAGRNELLCEQAGGHLYNDGCKKVITEIINIDAGIK